MSQYSIGKIRRGTNNFFESLTNSSNPQYIQPIQQPAPQPVIQPTYVAPQPLTAPNYVGIQHQPLPTVTYTPSSLSTSFVPLNSSYNSR